VAIQAFTSRQYIYDETPPMQLIKLSQYEDLCRLFERLYGILAQL